MPIPPSAPAAATPVDALTPDDFDTLDSILDALRVRFEEVPQWEFCEGFMAALLVCRRPIAPEAYFPALLGVDIPAPGTAGDFDSAAQAQQFVQLWTRRWNEVLRGLHADVKSLDDDTAYHPEVMDVRGAIAMLPAQDRAALGEQVLPSFAQVWALGFMFAVETWPEEWAPPRDREAAKWLDAALQSIIALTEDDTGVPTVSVLDDAGPPSVSEQRLQDFADAVWAVYDLRELWSHIGPRVEALHKQAEPGRNDPCDCGSGKKYKKCHGA